MAPTAVPRTTSNPKLVVSLKPIQPIQLWTFDGVLSLLRAGQSQYVLDAVDEFLLLNSAVLKSSSPFAVETKQILNKKQKDFSLREVLYSGASEKNMDDAESLARLLLVDAKEALRIIVQTSNRMPEAHSDTEKVKSKLPDDSVSHKQQQRLQLYVSRILRERRTVLHVVIELLNNKSNPSVSSAVQNLGRDLYLSTNYCSSMISTIGSLIDTIQEKGPSSENDINNIIYSESVATLIVSLKVVVELVTQNGSIDNNLAISWFKLMRSTNFMSILASSIRESESFMVIESISTAISVVLLDLIDTNSVFDASQPNHLEPSKFQEINTIISASSNHNTIIIFYWSIILYKKQIYLEETSSTNSENALTNIFSSEIVPSLHTLQARCEGVYQQISTTAEILRFDNIFAAILSNVLIAAIPLVSMTPEVSKCIQEVLKNAPRGMIQKFFEDPTVQQALIITRAKFPLLLSPYINLAGVSGTFAFNEFNELKSYMSLFKRDEFEMLTEIDDENTELVKLSQTVDIFPPFEQNKKLSLLMGLETKAKVIPAANEDEVLATFLYKFNGWSFLGRVLQNLSKNFDFTDREKVDTIVDIMSMLTKVVGEVSVEDSKHALTSMSAYTDDSDVLEVIFRLFEQSLHSRNIRMIESILNLLTQLVPIFSYRIWPAFSKSALLFDGTREGFATVIFGSIEMVNGDFRLTIALAKLTDALVYDCLTLDNAVPSKVKEAVLKKLVSHLIAVMESYAQCNFRSFQQKMETGVILLDAFRGILASVYGIHHHGKTAKDNVLIATLVPAAETLLSTFTNQAYGSARSFYPIISMIESLSDGLTQYELLDCLSFWYLNWIQCSLSFAQLVISIRTSLRLPVSPFEIAMFQRLPDLVSAYASYECLGNDLLNTLTALANGLNSGTQDAGSRLSMLSHLGREHSKSLRASLISDLENLLDDHAIKISLYDFICAVMGGRQEGLAVLLSGRNVFGDPKGSPEMKEDVSLIRVLKKKVEDIRYYPMAVSLHLVDAVTLVFSSWLAVRELENDLKFVNELLQVAQEYALGNETTDSDDAAITRCYRLKLCSKIVQILSSFLFSSNSEACKSAIIKAITSQSFIDNIANVLTIRNYDSLLHSKLRESFENLLPNLKLDDFSSALIKRNRFGPSTVYNFVLLDKLIPRNQQGEQLRQQILDASMNIQYVQAQIALSKAYGAMISSYVQQSSPIDSKVFGLVLQLLKANAAEDVPASTFEDVYYERIQLAFFILYNHFNSGAIKDTDHRYVFEIIKTIMTLFSTGTTNLTHWLTENQKLRLHAPLLRMLFCCLTTIQGNTNLITEHFNLFKSIFELVVARGTNLILILVQNDVYRSKTKTADQTETMDSQLDNLQLILSITKVFMKMKASESLKYEFSSAVESNGTIRSLLNLYSFAHSITVDGEHIFAQLSLMFIQDLMSMDVLARNFVDSGLLLVLIESLISTPIIEGGISIVSAPHYHRIWTNGILPILLVTLQKLGPLVLPAVCYDLKFFRKQIGTCIESWSRDASSIQITTALVSETSQILLLYKILSAFLDNAVSVLPGLDTEENREEFAECLNNLLKHPKFLSSRVAPSSQEELRVWEQDDDGRAMSAFVGELIEEIRDLKDMMA